MNPLWKSLLWKEWHEHKWKLAALSAIMFGVPLLLLDWKEPLQWYLPFWITFIFFLPLATIFAAMGTAGGERSRGTLPFLQATPLNLPWLATIKLAFGFLTICLPAFAAIAVARVAWIVAISRDWKVDELVFVQTSVPIRTGDWSVDALLSVALFCGSLLIWVAAIGVNQESEVRAGVVGGGVVVLTWSLWIGVLYLLNAAGVASGDMEWGRIVSVALPGGIFSVERPLGIPWWRLALGFSLTHLPLTYWYISRFGQTEAANRWSRQPAVAKKDQLAWLAAPFSSPTFAIIWKQWRECLPIAAAGFICAAGLLLAGVTLVTLENRNMNARGEFSESMAIGMIYLFTVFGFLAGLIAGIGASVSDLEPKLMTFWRSRPIHVDRWFWIKFATGLLTLLLTFGLPILAGFGILRTFDFIQLTSLPFFLSIVLAYTASLMTGCLLRHTIYSVIVAFGTAFSVWGLVYGWTEGSLLGSLVMLSASVTMTLIAWLCTRYDWGLKM